MKHPYASSIRGLIEGPPGAKLRESGSNKPGIKLYTAVCSRKEVSFCNEGFCKYEIRSVPISEIPDRCPKCGASLNLRAILT